jgi:hypothetical protein
MTDEPMSSTSSAQIIEDEIWDYLEEAGREKSVGGRPKSAGLSAALAEMHRLATSGLSIERAAMQVFEDDAFPTGNTDHEGLMRAYHRSERTRIVDDIAQAIVDDDHEGARPRLTEFLARNRKGEARRRSGARRLKK